MLTCYQVFNNKTFQRLLSQLYCLAVIKLDMCKFESYQFNQSNLEPGVLSSRMSVLLFFQVSFTQDNRCFLQPVLCTKTICYLDKRLGQRISSMISTFNPSITLNQILIKGYHDGHNFNMKPR